MKPTTLWFTACAQELSPLLHENASMLEEVRAGVGCFHLIPDKRRLMDDWAAYLTG